MRCHPDADRPGRPSRLVGLASRPADETRVHPRRIRTASRDGPERNAASATMIPSSGDDPDAVAEVPDEDVEGGRRRVVILRNAEIRGLCRGRATPAVIAIAMTSPMPHRISVRRRLPERISATPRKTKTSTTSTIRTRSSRCTAPRAFSSCSASNSSTWRFFWSLARLSNTVTPRSSSRLMTSSMIAERSRTTLPFLIRDVLALAGQRLDDGVVRASVGVLPDRRELVAGEHALGGLRA